MIKVILRLYISSEVVFDLSWIIINLLSEEYEKGVEEFLQFSFKKNFLKVKEDFIFLVLFVSIKIHYILRKYEVILF